MCERNKCNCGFAAQKGVKRHANGEDGNSINATRGSKRVRAVYTKLKQMQSNAKD